MEFHVRVCRECGEEYRPDIEICADCGGELEDVYEDQGTPVRKAPRGDDVEIVDRSGHRTVFQTPRATDLVPMADRLKDRGIEFRLVEEEAPGEHARFSLEVPDAGVPAALDALADLIAPHAEADDVHALETSYEGGRYVRCPACGAEQGSGLAECAECGLALAPAVPACERCQAPLEEEGAPCAVCGGPSPIG